MRQSRPPLRGLQTSCDSLLSRGRLLGTSETYLKTVAAPDDTVMKARNTSDDEHTIVASGTPDFVQYVRIFGACLRSASP